MCWNKAALFKHVWDIAGKKDCLWVRWIHHTYLKNESIWEHKPPQTASYYWKELMNIRDEIMQKGKIVPGRMQAYTVKEGYNSLLTDGDKVKWAGQVWNRFNIPKHAFIFWLMLKGRLQTKDRLARFMKIDTRCVICGQEEESSKHLFFQCNSSRECLTEMKK